MKILRKGEKPLRAHSPRGYPRNYERNHAKKPHNVI